MAQPVALDLFAGAGGATAGLRAAGFNVVGAIESDAIAAESYRRNHCDVKLVERRIEDVDATDLRNELGLEAGQLTLLKACPPCQGYSSIGKGDADDPRNDLVAQVWRFVRAFRPRVVVLENVPGLARDGRLVHLIRQLRAVGYRASSYVVDATAFGVPQRRRRLIVVGFRDGLCPLPDVLEALLPESFVDEGMQTAGDALGLLAGVDLARDELHRSRPHSREVAERIAALPIAGTRFDLPSEHQLECHSKLDARNATASYSRVRADEPAPTMTTRCTTPACGQFVHPTEPRALTLREAATLQTFPLSYVFSGGPSQVERQIGNAVPVRMAEGIGRCLRTLLGAA